MSAKLKARRDPRGRLDPVNPDPLEPQDPPVRLEGLPQQAPQVSQGRQGRRVRGDKLDRQVFRGRPGQWESSLLELQRVPWVFQEESRPQEQRDRMVRQVGRVCRVLRVQLRPRVQQAQRETQEPRETQGIPVGRGRGAPPEPPERLGLQAQLASLVRKSRDRKGRQRQPQDREGRLD